MLHNNSNMANQNQKAEDQTQHTDLESASYEEPAPKAHKVVIFANTLLEGLHRALELTVNRDKQERKDG